MGVFDWLRDRLEDVADRAENALPHRCPIPWRPHALAPVFHGYHDLTTGKELAQSFARFHQEGFTVDLGAPVSMRILFPSIGGTPQSNEILWPCGQFPLVVIAHGQCFASGFPDAQTSHFRAWGRSRMAYQLARAGYVVVVPQLTGEDPGGDGDPAILRRVIDWTRTQWTHANLLAPAPSMALIGHSRGAVHAARLATEGGIAAYVGLSGDFDDWFSRDPGASDLLGSLPVPKLFTFGSLERVPGPSWNPPADDGERPPGTWHSILPPKHQAVVDEMAHFDYLPEDMAPCANERGPCEAAPAVMADVVTMFLGRYLRPPAVSALDSRVAATLIPREDWLDTLTVRQAFYSGSYLLGFPAVRAEDGECRLTLTFELGSGTSGIVRLPSAA